MYIRSILRTRSIARPRLGYRFFSTGSRIISIDRSGLLGQNVNYQQASGDVRNFENVVMEPTTPLMRFIQSLVCYRIHVAANTNNNDECIFICSYWLVVPCLLATS